MLAPAVLGCSGGGVAPNEAEEEFDEVHRSAAQDLTPELWTNILQHVPQADR